MRTTVDIPDATYRKLKAQAAREGTSVRTLVLRGVKVIVETRPKADHRVTLPLIPSKHPGTLAITHEEIYDLIGFP